jgi:hypothetical protein
MFSKSFSFYHNDIHIFNFFTAMTTTTVDSTASNYTESVSPTSTNDIQLEINKVIFDLLEWTATLVGVVALSAWVNLFEYSKHQNIGQRGALIITLSSFILRYIPLLMMGYLH